MAGSSNVGPINFKANKGGSWSVETVESGKGSFSVFADPKSYKKGYFRSATNPDGVGTAGPDVGPTQAD